MNIVQIQELLTREAFSILYDLTKAFENLVFWLSKFFDVSSLLRKTRIFRFSRKIYENWPNQPFWINSQFCVVRSPFLLLFSIFTSSLNRVKLSKYRISIWLTHWKEPKSLKLSFKSLKLIAKSYKPPWLTTHVTFLPP